MVVVAKAMGWSSAILGLYLLGLMLAAGKRGDGATKSGIGVRYRYRGLQIVKSVNDTLGQNIKGAAEQDIVGGRSKNVNLQIECEVAKSAGNVTSQTERFIHSAVSALHVQDYAGVVGNAEVVSDFSRPWR